MGAPNVNFEEEVFIEGFKKAETPWRMFAVAAVITNPWAGKYVEDLNPEIRAYGPILGELMTKRIIDLAAQEGAAGVAQTARAGRRARQQALPLPCL